MKKILSILVSFVLLFTVAFAAEPEASVSATFDLTQNGIQQIVTEDAEGNPVVVIVEKCSPSTRSESVGYGNSTWHIWYKSPLFTSVEFWMDVYVDSNGIATITDVYDGQYTVVGYEISFCELRINRATETATRSAQAEYYFEGILFTGGASANGWLRADIKDMTLTVSYY